MTPPPARQPLRMLVSYWYCRKLDMDALFGPIEGPLDIFADSGAFSAFGQGFVIDVDDYATWLKRWSHWFNVYANMDVIRDAEATWRNQVRMEDQHGLRPLPVFHIAEEWKWLDHYQQRYPYVALGGSGRAQGRNFAGPWIYECFKRTGAPQALRLHGFAMTSISLLRDLPWYSADSTSWKGGAMYGRQHVWSDLLGTLVILGRNQPVAERLAHAQTMQRLGVDLRDVYLGAKHDRHNYGALLGALSFRRFERALQRRHGTIPPPVGQQEPGLRLFLAIQNTYITRLHAEIRQAEARAQMAGSRS